MPHRALQNQLVCGRADLVDGRDAGTGAEVVVDQDRLEIAQCLTCHACLAEPTWRPARWVIVSRTSHQAVGEREDAGPEADVTHPVGDDQRRARIVRPSVLAVLDIGIGAVFFPVAVDLYLVQRIEWRWRGSCVGAVY